MELREPSSRRACMNSGIRRRLRRGLACASLAAVAAAAHGADDAPWASIAYRDCMQAAAGVNADTHACISAEAILQDARLNDAYAQLRAAQPARYPALQAAQRDWIRFRDSNCGYRNDPEGGSAARLAAGACLLRMTAERADELQTLLPPP
ncbi:MAG: DUF1311 domain-containing protein [Sterolibacteriaceae bacterium]|nr:DUF1311 domain-containing protein [Sterolibacteriaceae bacterium]